MPKWRFQYCEPVTQWNVDSAAKDCRTNRFQQEKFDADVDREVVASKRR